MSARAHVNIAPLLVIDGSTSSAGKHRNECEAEWNQSHVMEIYVLVGEEHAARADFTVAQQVQRLF